MAVHIHNISLVLMNNNFEPNWLLHATATELHLDGSIVHNTKSLIVTAALNDAQVSCCFLFLIFVILLLTFDCVVAHRIHIHRVSYAIYSYQTNLIFFPSRLRYFDNIQSRKIPTIKASRNHVWQS